MFEKLREIFKRAEYNVLKDDFMAMPSKDVLTTMRNKGWSFSPSTTVGGMRYGYMPVTMAMKIYSPEGTELRVGKTPELWTRYKRDREQALAKAYNVPKPR